MEPSNEQKLKFSIQAALAAGGDLPDREIAVFITNFSPDLIAEWVLEKLTALVHWQRSRPKPADPAQMAFPFHDLSVQLPIKKKETFELRGATIGLLKQSEKFLSQKKREAIDKPRPSSLLGRIQREIEMMQPYVYLSRKITVEQVHEMVAAGVPAPKSRDSRMSEAMTRFWDSKSPEERSEIARKRKPRTGRAGGGAG